VGALSTLLLLANGRPVGVPESAGVAGTILGAALWLPGRVLELDPTGRALLGKLLAALCAGVAAAALFSAVARRHALGTARASGVILAVGTTLAAASQSWSGEPAATAAVALAVLLLTRSALDDDPTPAAQAAVPLAVAVVLEPVTWALALALLAGSLVRWWRSALRLLAWAVPACLLAVLGASAPPGGETGALALLFSPARGLLVFAPVLLVGGLGVVRAARPPRLRWDTPRPVAWLPVTMAAGAGAHVAAVALQGGGDGLAGAFWGPRLLAPIGPLLLLFLPEGLDLLRGAGSLLVALSVAVQALGALSYDGRWNRLYGNESGVTWDPSRSPILFQVRERVVRPALPALDGRRLVVREHPLVVAGPTGSRVVFRDGAVVVTGADPTLGDVLLEGGARVVGDRVHLEGPGDDLFFRVRKPARVRRLELRIAGRGSGSLSVGESTFWTSTRWDEHPVRGTFDVRRPWSYAESGGGDVRVAVRGPGSVEVRSVALVPPGEPDDVIRLE
jgi:hypothetical protein